jgi:hypothetical protein
VGFSASADFGLKDFLTLSTGERNRRTAAVKGRVTAFKEGSTGIEPKTEGIKSSETRKTGCRARPQESCQCPRRLAMEAGSNADHGI